MINKWKSGYVITWERVWLGPPKAEPLASRTGLYQFSDLPAPLLPLSWPESRDRVIGDRVLYSICAVLKRFLEQAKHTKFVEDDVARNPFLKFEDELEELQITVHQNLRKVSKQLNAEDAEKAHAEQKTCLTAPWDQKVNCSMTLTYIMAQWQWLTVWHYDVHLYYDIAISHLDLIG